MNDQHTNRCANAPSLPPLCFCLGPLSVPRSPRLVSPPSVPSPLLSSASGKRQSVVSRPSSSGSTGSDGPPGAGAGADGDLSSGGGERPASSSASSYVPDDESACLAFVAPPALAFGPLPDELLAVVAQYQLLTAPPPQPPAVSAAQPGAAPGAGAGAGAGGSGAQSQAHAQPQSQLMSREQTAALVLAGCTVAVEVALNGQNFVGTPFRFTYDAPRSGMPGAGAGQNDNKKTPRKPAASSAAGASGGSASGSGSSSSSSSAGPAAASGSAGAAPPKPKASEAMIL